MVHAAKNGGEQCGGVLKEVRPCNEDVVCEEKKDALDDVDSPPAPVDCEWSAWDTWSACTVTCGGGVKLRQRQILAMANESGKPCESGGSMEVAACNEEALKKHWTMGPTFSSRKGQKKI